MKERFEDMFGIEACRNSIKWYKEVLNKSYEQQLKEYEEIAKIDILFNKTMITACKELIKEEE